MRGRFAPSPTGYIHLGNVWSALLAWLQVRQAGGTLVLRIEDIDEQRSKPIYTRALMEDLHWLGLNWDEGPDVGGPVAPYIQSERMAMYKEYADEESDKMPQLRKKDLAEFIGCDDKTIQNYRTGKSLPDTIEKVMLICLALETGPKVSKHLIEKSVGAIPDVGNKKIAYETLLEHTYLPLDEWNRILENNFDLPPIKFK